MKWKTKVTLLILITCVAAYLYRLLHSGGDDEGFSQEELHARLDELDRTHPTEGELDFDEVVA